MTITTEQAELLARMADLNGPTRRGAALRSLAGERDALQAENARLREALREIEYLDRPQVRGKPLRKTIQEIAFAALGEKTMSDNNGWTGKPGVPLNPEWDGAHHWLSYEGEEPGLYEWDGKYWKMGGGHAPMDYVVDHFTYIAPALTPAEVEARVAQARRDALEEAARVVEAVKTWDDHYDYCESCKGGAVYPDSKEVAAAIRALKGEGDG